MLTMRHDLVTRRGQLSVQQSGGSGGIAVRTVAGRDPLSLDFYLPNDVVQAFHAAGLTSSLHPWEVSAGSIFPPNALPSVLGASPPSMLCPQDPHRPCMHCRRRR